MEVSINHLATGGYYLCWYTPSFIRTVTGDRCRHEDHITSEQDIEAMSRAFGWSGDSGKTFEEYLDMVCGDEHQDIPNTIDLFDLPEPWKHKIFRPFPNSPPSSCSRMRRARSGSAGQSSGTRTTSSIINTGSTLPSD